MDNELQKKKPEQKQKDSSLSTIFFSTLIIVLLVLVELFLMIVMPQMIPAIAGVGVVIVGCTYLDLSAYIKRLQKKEQEQEEQYASILKSEKAAYLLIRKYFDEIEEQLTLMEDKLSDPFQEIVAAQKATAKVVINRNKENTDAVLNSNDKMFDIVLNLDTRLHEVSDVIPAALEEHAKNQNAVLMQKQTEMSNQMRELELSLKNEILQAVNKLSSASPQVVMASPQMMPMQQPIAAPVNEEPESLTASDDFGELGGLGDLPDFVPLDVVEDETPEPEPVLGEAPELNMGGQLEPLMDLDPMTEPDAGSEPIAEESAKEPEPEPEAMPELMPEPEAMPELMPELEPMPEPEPEPTVEEAPPMPDLSDPNKVMSPDDISALLASMAADTASAASLPNVEEVAEEPEPEPMPLPEPEPAVEEVPPMPDLSDPNHKMSPDEIAALFANLG